MEEILKYSALNPLATCFVPSNIKMACTGRSKKYCNIKYDNQKLEVESPKVSKAVMKFQTEVYPKDQLGMILPYPTIKVEDSRNSITKLFNENLYISKQCVNLTHSKPPSSPQLTVTDVAAFLRFLFLTLLGFYSHRNRLMDHDTIDICEMDSKSDESIISKSDEKCSCPPMFGCIIPPDFFGNPFNLNSKCSKQCVHVSHYAKPDAENDVDCPPSNCSSEINFLKAPKKTKLEQYSCEMGEIVKDVCNILSLAAEDDIEDSPYFNENADSVHEVTRTEDSNRQDSVSFNESIFKDERFHTAAMSSGKDNLNIDNLNIEMEIPKGTPKDDFHPLLDEGISMESDYEGVYPVTEKMVESRFSPRYKERLSFDPEEMSEKTICNPPCSVWCDSLPQPAKDTYKKFIDNLPPMEHLWDFSNAENSEIFHSKNSKPAFKRSFSANDCPKENVDPFHLYIEPASKARTFLNGHSTSNFKFNKPGYMEKDRTSLPLSGNSSSSNSRCKDTDMWGPFAGADSLWQPLPDCAPSYEQCMKQGAHKRVRELKRQVSLS